MVYDGQRERVLLFGGHDLGVLFADTWEWDGAVWTQMADMGPSPRYSHAMAYDPVRQRVFLFGGFSLSGRCADTWEWDGSEWTQVGDIGPSARNGHGMVFDDALQRVLLFGGHCGSDPTRPLLDLPQDDAWTWDGIEWTQIADTGPPARAYHAMTFESIARRTLLFGGDNLHGNTMLNDTWAFDNGLWRSISDMGPQKMYQPRMVQAVRGVVLFGQGDTWEWDGQRWTQRQNMGPPNRSDHALAYDIKRDRVVLFGGYSGPTSFGDTWELRLHEG